jgi:hypothetical protein
MVAMGPLVLSLTLLAGYVILAFVFLASIMLEYRRSRQRTQPYSLASPVASVRTIDSDGKQVHASPLVC